MSPFSAMTPLAGWQEEHRACKKSGTNRQRFYERPSGDMA